GRAHARQASCQVHVPVVQLLRCELCDLSPAKFGQDVSFCTFARVVPASAFVLQPYQVIRDGLLDRVRSHDSGAFVSALLSAFTNLLNGLPVVEHLDTISVGKVICDSQGLDDVFLLSDVEARPPRSGLAVELAIAEV